MLNKTFCLLLLSLIPIFGFSQANSQYPDSGNKIRLGFQTSGDGLIWRDTQPKAGGYQPINNKAAWIILDTMNNKFYHYKNSTWTLAGGQDIDTANLIATKYDLGFKLATTDTGDMLTPYWRSGRFSGVLPVANGGTGATSLSPNNYLIRTNSSGIFDTAAIYEADGKVGIGTATPFAQLSFNGNYTGSGLQAFEMTRTGISRDSARFSVSNGTNSGGQFIPTFTSLGNWKSSTLTIGGIFSASPQEDDSSDDVAWRIAGTRKDGTIMTTGAIVEFSTLNNIKMKIMANGNVGIGTTSPTAVLHLKAGTATASTAPLKFTSGVALTTPEVGAMEFSNISGTNRLLISPADNVRKEIAYTDFSNTTGTLPVANGGTGQTTLAAAGINTGSGTANYLPKYTAATTLGNSLIYDNGSVVAIGTPSPIGGFLLQLVGANSRLAMINSSGATGNFSQLLFGNGVDGNTYAEMIRYNNNKQWSLYNGGGDIFFSTNYVSSYRHDLFVESDNGNVGIGTASPLARLQVKGSGISTGEAFKIENSIGTNLLTVLDNGSMTLNTPLSVANGGTGENMSSLPNNYLVRKNSSGIFDTANVYEANGNIGLNVIPSAWGSQFKAIESGDNNNQSAVTFNTGANGLNFFANAFFDGSNTKYKYNGFATRFVTADGKYEYYNTPSGVSGNNITWTEVMTIDASGNLGINQPNPTEKLHVVGNGLFTGNLGVGGATPTTSGSGITFPATQAGSTNVNTLDDYEEGTWTPTVEGAITNPTMTYSVRTATYNKIGRLVIFELLVRGNRTAGGSGRIKISGLPFTSAEVYGYGGVVSNSNVPTTIPFVGNVVNSTSSILFYTNTFANTDVSNWCSDCFLYYSGYYHTN